MESAYALKEQVLRIWDEKYNDPLAGMLLEFIRKPDDYPALKKRLGDPEYLLDGGQDSVKRLSKILFEAGICAPDKALEEFFSRLNLRAGELDKALYQRALEIRERLHDYRPRPYAG